MYLKKKGTKTFESHITQKIQKKSTTILYNNLFWDTFYGKFNWFNKNPVYIFMKVVHEKNNIINIGIDEQLTADHIHMGHFFAF